MATKQTEKTQALQQTKKAVVPWKGEQITITFQDVKTLICPLATDQETRLFLRTCQSLRLNPFAKEIYLIKYNPTDKAALVIAIDSYLKAAETNNNFDGHEAGIILKDSGGKLEFRDNTFLLDEERAKLVGGWAKVHRKDRSWPIYVAIHKVECIKYTRDGKPTQFWTEKKQPWMLRKTALKRALVEAFPSLFAGTLATSEVAGDIEGEFQEKLKGTLPLGLITKDGKPNWPKVWAKIKDELNLTKEQVHELLHVESIKKDLIDQGMTMETFWEKLINAVQGQQATELEQIVDAETGEITPEEKEFSEEENAPEGEEFPQVDEELLKGWQIVKATVKELNITDSQIRKWFAHFNIEIGLSEFSRALPPEAINNEILSKFQTILDVYRERQRQKAM